MFPYNSWLYLRFAEFIDFSNFPWRITKFSEAECWRSEIPTTERAKRGLSDTAPASKEHFFHSIALGTRKGRRSRNVSLSLIITFVGNLENFPFSVPCKVANGNAASPDVCMMVTSRAGLLKKTSFSYFFHRYYTNTLWCERCDSGLGSGKIKRKTISCLCLRWNFLFSISCQAIRWWCCGMMLVCNFHIKR